LTDTDKQNTTGNTQTNCSWKKANDSKYSKSKPPWFSHLLRHSARKRYGLQ